MESLELDKIHVTGIRYYGYTGYLNEEQVLGQWFEVDLTFWLDVALAGKSDRIEDTFDYREAIDITKKCIENNKFALVEKLATVIADELLHLGRVEQIRVQLSKPAAPIPDFGGKISIDITRRKPR